MKRTPFAMANSGDFGFPWEPAPDYRRLLKTVRHEEPDRVPLAELGVDPSIKARCLGRAVANVRDDVEFWWRAGYDYIPLRPAYEFPHTMPSTTTTGTPGYGGGMEDAPASVSLAHPGVIGDFPDLDRYPWPEPATDAYYAPLREAAACLPEGMGIISGVGGIFTRTWMLLGFEEFCLALSERPGLVVEIFDRVGTIQCAALRRVVACEKVVAVWYGDDLAYSGSTLVSPEVYRRYLFPWMERLASIAHDAGLPFFFHSDGKLWDVIPDLIALGVDALHPIEPKAMDINEVKVRYGERLALIGNIDMNLMALGKPGDVRALVRRRIRDLAPGGGYAVGVNPGVAHYVRLENYHALRETTLTFGRYPIARGTDAKRGGRKSP
ncbi:MAG: nucleoside 2-deoxyribosyltransferase [Planctomycetota bacterium]|nr:nucleoside 2-deoxyribosyltransferase [Planctomycetota bacterium]